MALHFLTATSDGSRVRLYTDPSDGQSCMELATALQRHVFCARKEEGTAGDMQKLATVIEQHLKVVTTAKELQAATAMLQRLVDAGATDANALQADATALGDGSHQISILELSQVNTSDAVAARSILARVRSAVALIDDATDIGNGVALLQQAFAAAHLNPQLMRLMQSSPAASRASALLQGPGAAAASGAGAGVAEATQLGIIMSMCGGGAVCLGAGVGILVLGGASGR
eukprot:TRINITY_DN60761_c0_g1_i2.p1 TRINITY_DN60761_c0_g1~~TRINITY_DN60761_c0_g1_i2.p1  ORF type:complete len:230 (-),score=42.51 TRINITY_DN60761_c0_g1_i2:54-743(-)